MTDTHYLQKLQDARDTLDKLAGSEESQADAVLKVLKDLEEIEQQASDNQAIRAELVKAREKAAALRNRLWQDGRRLMKGRSLGLSLGRRRKQAERSVRLLQKAVRLDREDLSALREDLAKAEYRLKYLQGARLRARVEQGRRLAIYALIGAAVVIAVLLFLFISGLLGSPSPEATATPTSLSQANQTVRLTLPPTSTAAPLPSPTATLAPTQPATPAPSQTTSPPPTHSATPAPSSTATASVAPSATPTPPASNTPTATPTLRPTNTPTARPRAVPPTRTPTPRPTVTPTPGIIYPAPTLRQPDDLSLLSQSTFSVYWLGWEWDGALGADEWFDVRVWRPGLPHYGVAWTKQEEYLYDICLQGNGDYAWSVAVILGKDGQWLADLSPEAAPLRFSASRSDEWCEIKNRYSLPLRVRPQ